MHTREKELFSSSFQIWVTRRDPDYTRENRRTRSPPADTHTSSKVKSQTIQFRESSKLLSIQRIFATRLCRSALTREEKKCVITKSKVLSLPAQMTNHTIRKRATTMQVNHNRQKPHSKPGIPHASQAPARARAGGHARTRTRVCLYLYLRLSP